MSNLGNHFNDEAEKFDKTVHITIPRYEEMTDVLISCIPYDNEDIKVLDLGCGTGNITMKVLERFPNAHVTCLDISENMLGLAKRKLASYDSIEYVLGDFTIIDIIDSYDVIISSLALHHITTDEAKLDMYQHIYDALNEGGIFYNADVVKSNSEYLEQLNESVFVEFMKSNGLSQDEIDAHKQKRHANDFPITLTKHIQLMQKVGFTDAEVIWKYYSNAIYGASK